MSLRLVAVPLLSLSLAACANVVGDEPNPPGDGLALEGSYELAFTAANATMDYGGPPAPEAVSPSIGNHARLDLRRTPAGGFEAIFTGRWGTPAAYKVAVSDDALTLTGEGRISGAAAYGSRGDTWETITLVRNKSGLLTGEVRANGHEELFQGDVGWRGTLTGTGNLIADAIAPEVRLAPSSRIGPVDQLLPWDTLIVTAAEPLVAKDVADATHVATTGKSLPLTWLPTKNETWAGATTFEARVDDWASAMIAAPWQISQSAGVRDRVGNSSAGAISPLSFIRLPTAVRAIDFDTDSLDAAFWGTADVLGGGIAGTDDPRCESGGCLRLGPARFDGCTPERAGMAALLTRGSTNRVAVRFRVLADSIYGDTEPMLYGSLLTVQLASPGGAVATKQIDSTTTKPTWTKLSTPVDGMTWASAWTTVTVDAPPGTAPIGVAVAAGTQGYGCGGPAFPAANVAYLIETVATE